MIKSSSPCHCPICGTPVEATVSTQATCPLEITTDGTLVSGPPVTYRFAGTRPFRVSCPTCGTTWPTARSYYLDMTLWELVAKTGKAPSRRAPRGFWPLLVRSWNQATGRHDNAQAMRSRYSRLRKEWTRHNTSSQ